MDNSMTTRQGQNLPAERRQDNASERFTQKVLSEFASSAGGALQVTDFQKRLIQGYFIQIDRALNQAEENRLAKNRKNTSHQYDEELPVTWKNVNIPDLALDLVHYARMGLDMQQDNMLFPIPYKNNKNNNYDITLMEGYNGKRYIARKYAMEIPVGEVIELVYSTDTFVPHAKDSSHPTATYEFQINNPFDRGEIIGGFGYLEFADPAKNELIIMSMKDILKRKPEYASSNFWGGTKKEWKTVDGKRQQVEVETDGWFEEMCRKTIIREVYSAKHLPIDPQKIDDSYRYTKAKEARYAEIEAQAEIDANANTISIDTTTALPAPETQRKASAQLPGTSVMEPVPIQVDHRTGELIGAAPNMKIDDDAQLSLDGAAF